MQPIGCIYAILSLQTQDCTAPKALQPLMLCKVREVQGSQDTGTSQGHSQASAK